MNKAAANRYLADKGYPHLEVDKAEGVYYLVGGHDDPSIDHTRERCLHVCRMADLTTETLDCKLSELTQGN